MGTSFLIVLVALVFVGLIVLSIWHGAKRKKDLAEWGAAHGLAFQDMKDHGLEHRFPNFKCLRTGSARYGYNFLRGEWQGLPYESFDYHYETHSTDSKGQSQTHHHYFSCVVLRSRVPLRPLFIRPEGFFDKISEFFGADDIDFESAEFSRTFFVKSPDRRWAYDVIHTRTMEFLLAQPRFSIEFDHECVMAWRRRTFRPEEFGQAAGVIHGLLDRLPNYLVQQQTSLAK